MKLVPKAISTKVARQALLGRKSAPTVLFATGVTGMVGSTVLACRSTLKLQDTLERTHESLKKASELRKEAPIAAEKISKHFEATGELRDDLMYKDWDQRRDVAVIYLRGIFDVAKLYAPSVLLGAASIACLTKSQSILNQRNAALTAAYVAVDEAFSRYRERVVRKYGETQDREFRFGVEEVEMVDEKGKMTTEKLVGSEDPSMYARFFDEYSSNWTKNHPDYNYIFLQCQQKYMNDMLKARGHLFLNEVYDALGLSRTKAGSVVGWVVSEGGDNFVDFGVFNDREGRSLREFINGREGSVLLDFNVDGIIYDKIDHNQERLRWQS